MFDSINFNNIVELFNSYFSSYFDNISLINIYYFIFYNKYILFFLLIIYFFILVDNTFKWINKIFIFVYICFFLFFFLLFKGNFFINEIFWYTLTLNGAFIFHSCICDWLYRLFVYLNWDYGCFLITRVSFIFSLSFIVYLLHLFNLYMSDFYDNTKFRRKKWFILLIYNINIFWFILQLILLFFIYLFTNYVLLLKGIKIGNLNLKNILNIFFFVLITMFISIVILGIPRLYFIWLAFGCLYIYELIKDNDYKFKYIYWNFLNIADFDFNRKIIKIGFDYNATNIKGFNYGFIYFIDYTTTFRSFEDLDFHLKCPFLYYNRSKILLTYFRSYFKKMIRLYKCIPTECYIGIFNQAEMELNLSNIEKDLLHKKFKKIYKKALKK